MEPNENKPQPQSFYGPPQPTNPPVQPVQNWGQQSPPAMQPQQQFPQPQYGNNTSAGPQPNYQQPPAQYQAGPPPIALPHQYAQPQILNAQPSSRGPKGPFALMFNDFMKRHWKLVIGCTIGVILLGTIIFQIVYPNSRLLPGATVDGVNLGGMRKTDAAEELNGLYGDLKLAVYFGKNDAAFQTTTMKNAGIAVDNEARLNAITYPFYLRLIPGSFLWAGGLNTTENIEYTYDRAKIEAYTQSEVYNGCDIPAKDASLRLIDSQVQIVPSVPGGTCDITQFQKVLSEVKPSSDIDNEVRVEIAEKPAKVDNEKARELADMLNNRLKEPMPMTVANETQQIPGRIVLGWLDFKSDIPPDSIDDSANRSAKLIYEINVERMKTYLDSNVASKVVKKPGVSKISTKDFTETSRQNGEGGTEIDLEKVTASVDAYISNKSQQSSATTRAVGPTLVYDRSYTPTSTGFSAMLAQFAEDNPGTYGMAFTEVGSVRNPRSASYRADAQYPAAGVQAMYYGYGVVTDQFDGILRPAEKIAGDSNVEACLKDMIEKSDADCRQGFYNRLGFERITAKGKEVGLTGTTFAGEATTTTAKDIHSFMTRLQANQIARIQGGQRLLGLTKTVRSSDGVPASVNSGEAVGHIVGETVTIRHDAAIVNSNKGTYILTVMSDGSSWENIAKLTKKIQDLKAVKVPNN